MWEGRGWINVTFWLLWLGVGILVLYVERSAKPELQISICSVAIALAALWQNVFPRFIQGPRLKAQINQITVLSIPGGNRMSMITSIAVHDLLSTTPSAGAQRVLRSMPAVAEAVQRRDQNALLQLFSQTHPTLCHYLLEDDAILKFLEDSRCTPPFFIPLTIHNSGGETGHVASVVMTLRLQDTPKRGKGSPERTWAYGAYAEIDPKAVSDPRKQLADMDIISCLFSGCSVPPGATTRIDLHFTPHHEAGERMISDSNVIPGDYVLKVIGFNEKGKQVFRTEGIPYPLAANTLLACFKNGQWTYYPNMDRNIWASLSRLKPRSRCIAAVAGVVNILQRERCLNPCEYEHIQGLDLLDALQGQPVKSCKVRCHCVASFSRSVRQSKS